LSKDDNKRLPVFSLFSYPKVITSPNSKDEALYSSMSKLFLENHPISIDGSDSKA